MRDQTLLVKATKAATPAQQLRVIVSALDAIREDIEAQRQHIFDTQAVASVMGEVFSQPEHDHIARTCELIGARLNEACTAFELMANNINEHCSAAAEHENEHGNAGVENG